MYRIIKNKVMEFFRGNILQCHLDWNLDKLPKDLVVESSKISKYGYQTTLKRFQKEYPTYYPIQESKSSRIYTRKGSQTGHALFVLIIGKLMSNKTVMVYLTKSDKEPM